MVPSANSLTIRPVFPSFLYFKLLRGIPVRAMQIDTESIHGQDLMRLRELVHPAFDLSRLLRVLAPRQLDAGLQLAHRQCGQKYLVLAQSAKPGDNGAVL